MTEEKVETEETQEEVAQPGGRVSCHIYINADYYEQVVDWAEYAAIEGLIEGHPRGNFSSYCNFCFNIAEQYLREHMLKKRGYQ